MQPVANRLSVVVKALNQNQADFARELDLPRGTVNNLLNGHRKPSFATLERIVNQYPQVSAEYLLRGSGEPLKS